MNGLSRAAVGGAVPKQEVQPMAKPSAPQAEAGTDQMKVRRVPLSELEPGGGNIVISGGSGSQGAAFALEAARNKLAGKHDRDVLILARNVKAVENVQVTVDGQTHSLKDLGVKVVASLDGLVPEKTIVVSTVPSKGLASILRTLPQGLEGIVATYNGAPPDLGAGLSEPDHAVSIVTSGTVPDGKGFTFNKGGLLKVNNESPIARDLEAIFGGGHINVELAGNIKQQQWAKVALNSTLNSLATVFGMSIGDLAKAAETDARIMGLVRSVTKEVCDIAAADGHPVNADPVLSDIFGVVKKFPNHPTSMGIGFRAGKEIEVDVLTQRVAALGRAHGIPTPACEAATKALTKLLELRGDRAIDPAVFYKDERVKAAQNDCLGALLPRAKL